MSTQIKRISNEQKRDLKMINIKPRSTRTVDATESICNTQNDCRDGLCTLYNNTIMIRTGID